MSNKLIIKCFNCSYEFEVIDVFRGEVENELCQKMKDW